MNTEFDVVPCDTSNTVLVRIGNHGPFPMTADAALRLADQLLTVALQQEDQVPQEDPITRTKPDGA